MAKFDALNAKLDDLSAAVAALPVVEDDTADVASLVTKVEDITAAVKAKDVAPTVDNPTSAPSTL